MSQKENNLFDNQKEEDNYLICESCGNKMTERGSKLRCERCSYFRSVVIDSRKAY